jgi:penicillin-binding protein 1A
MKSSNRWAVMKSLDKSEEEIKSFSEKQNDCIFLERRKDTIMTPLDSIRYYKHFYNQD